jgi:hypothetical protein
MATSLPPPARFAGALRYEHTDIPAGVTLAAWRRRRRRSPRSPGIIGRLLRHALRRR